MNNLYLMQGISGSGKSTIANMILENDVEKTEIASTDDLWIDEYGKYNFDASKLGEKHKENQEFVKHLMNKGIRNIIVDNTNLTNKDVEPYLKLAKEYKYTVRIISVSCSFEESKRGNSNRSDDRKVPENILERQKQRMERINLDESC